MTQCEIYAECVSLKEVGWRAENYCCPEISMLAFAPCATRGLHALSQGCAEEMRWEKSHLMGCGGPPSSYAAARRVSRTVRLRKEMRSTSGSQSSIPVLVWTVRIRDSLNEQGHIKVTLAGRLVTIPVTKPYVTLHVCRLGAYAYPETVHNLRAR